jgi:MFS family permease
LLNARRDQPSLRLLLLAAAALGTFMTAAALMPTYWLYALALVPVGLASITVLNSCNTAVQLSTPAHLRGRVLSLYLAVQTGTTPVGAPIVGWLGTEFGVRWSVLTGGIAALAAAIFGTIALVSRPDIAAVFARSLGARSAENAAVADTAASDRQLPGLATPPSLGDDTSALA